MDNKIIIIAGPTASGKTSVGITLARAVNGEIISADSMQIYKHMPIATAAPTEEEKRLAVHHLTEFLEPDEDFSAALWCKMAKEKADDILSRGKVPIIVGGTGLFIDSFADNILFEDVAVDKDLRARLMAEDCDDIYRMLAEIDPDAAKNIHPNNKKRVARALELYYAGTSKTEQNRKSRKEKSPYDFLYIVIEYENRQILYDRINKRVEAMVKNGLLDEASLMLKTNRGTSKQAIGHKELAKYLNGEMSYDDALEELKKETRHYAKRQITWFKRRQDAVRIKFDDSAAQAEKILVGKCEEFLYG